MNRIVASFLILTWCLSISAQSVALSGKISNSNGKPVTGANVSLVTKKLTATTDSKGEYSILTNVAIKTPAPVLPAVKKFPL